ncbi:aldehyde dehydrogenase family protein [Rhizobium hidalgonense]|uniref:aldehyde dehydrogenase (NAD(+)) n=1 Tax=Rhizobium hidalgonense TaxID=1538159 RepID=A0A2A6K8Q4_9HYPH|nr:aldehyde dehydrogenase family protein [Rhizobium hidalgonense]MDR9776066.1 aldehyde dehydrogenase family protein [Rhizobium hidalgonense]MDR9820873.1 aldehyde dehydrogenase family protein [Rhizobium hidalgonense]PDT20910.1 aldehyde dehydrogenase family protein [Rhizobium hidalgonense]PON07142.1 aldehyde dehydrogenase [Rhizobium hidalgonense]
MKHAHSFYIDGKWVEPSVSKTLEVIDPSTEEPMGTIALGSAADTEKAVAAARRAFASFSETSKEERIELLRRIVTILKRRNDELGDIISREMGAPLAMARAEQAGIGALHFQQTIKAFETFASDYMQGTTCITREPVGVVAMITPWNWPINQIACKVAPALATGCTMVLKPSEIAPFNAVIFTEIMDEAGVPKGVFNLVHGDGPTVGTALASHPDVDMVSFTGSTRAGIAVAQAAAPTVKRVHQELGGKSPNIILRSADFSGAVAAGVRRCFGNSGQTCTAPTRMLVPAERMEEASSIAAREAAALVVGPPSDPCTDLGPVASGAQFDKIQALIERGIAEGAELIAGGPGRPSHLNSGYYVRPTVFARVTNQMTIAREEIFGPVLSIIGYDSEDEAIAIANDTPYGLAAYIQGDPEEARALAGRLRAGSVRLNNSAWDSAAPFGGYKQSGNGREYGKFGLQEFTEIKGIAGFANE